MNSKQRAAIDLCMEDLCNDLQHNVDGLLNYFEVTNKTINHAERNIIESKRTDEGKLIVFFGQIPPKDGSWDTLIRYLDKTKNKVLKEKLLRAAGEWVDQSAENNSSSVELHKPTEQAIRENQQFYLVEQTVYKEIQETKGLLELKPQDYEDSAKDVKAKFYKADKVYSTFSKPKGLALIINNRDFNGIMPTRIGTDVDAKNSESLWKNFGYVVKTVENQTAKGILQEMLNFAADKNHKTSAVVVILSHGGKGGVYGVDGNLVPIDHIVAYLNAKNCPSLANKPKLVIIQACRGEHLDGGVQADSADSESVAPLIEKLSLMDEADSKQLKDKIPTDADIIICFATTPGYVSWRNHVNGSWFIQSLCETFYENAHEEHLLDMLTTVSNRVADVYTQAGYKQIPQFHTSLRKKFFIFPGVYE